MSYESEAIARTLQGFADARLSPSLIDTAHQLGKITDDMVVATSIGSVSRAVIMPYYPAIQFGNNIFDRLDAAAARGYPFAEAAIRVTGQDLRRPTRAQVILRFCHAPEPSATTVISETACAFNLSDTSSYGTTERVVDEIYRRRQWGEFLPSLTGTVNVPVPEHRDANGKWRRRASHDPRQLARAVWCGISEIDFAKPMDFVK